MTRLPVKVAPASTVAVLLVRFSEAPVRTIVSPPMNWLPALVSVTDWPLGSIEVAPTTRIEPVWVTAPVDVTVRGPATLLLVPPRIVPPAAVFLKVTLPPAEVVNPTPPVLEKSLPALFSVRPPAPLLKVAGPGAG